MSSKKFNYKKAIVTGGAGFIGSHIVEELLEMGLEVLSIDDYVAGKKENLKDFLSNPNFWEVDCDITNYNKFKKYFKGVDIIFHEAASKKTICLKDPRRDLEINAEGAFNVLELSKKFGVRKIVHASTGSVYGEALYFPQNEKHPLNPTSFYGVSKLAGEKYTKIFERFYNMDITVLRYFHVYGPRQESSDKGGVVAIFARRAISNQPLIIFGDGTQQRSFTYVKDVVAANILVAQRQESKGECYNCASGIKVSVKELANKTLDFFNKKELKIKYSEWLPGDIKVFDIDNSKLRSLGFNFKANFEEGLCFTLEWFKGHFNEKSI